MNTKVKSPLTAYEYIIATSERFNQICKPLLNLGIPYFGYIKVFEDGKYLYLNNNLEFNKAHISTIRNVGTYFTNALVYHKSSSSSFDKYRYFSVPSDISQFDRKKNPILHLLYDFNIWHCFGICRKNLNHLETYTFGMTRNDEYANEFYFKYLPLLERFITYFNEKAADLINTNDVSKLGCFDQKFNFNINSKEKIIPGNIQRFFNETRLQSNIIQGKTGEIKLSRREVECLEYLSLGYSNKETGKALKLTGRTIDFYFHNIKKKTGFHSREEALTQFILNNNRSNKIS